MKKREGGEQVNKTPQKLQKVDFKTGKPINSSTFPVNLNGSNKSQKKK
jgi:hypothetical protein